jgi:hypothetical protein
MRLRESLEAVAELSPEAFEEHWAHKSARTHRWRGLALYGADGTTLRVPDSPANASHFGYARSVRGESAYLMVRGVGLMAPRSHLLAVAFGPYETSEIAYAVTLWSSVPRDSLTIVDRGFLSARILIPLARDGANRSAVTTRWRGHCRSFNPSNEPDAADPQ